MTDSDPASLTRELTRQMVVALALVVAIEGGIVHLILGSTLDPPWRWVQWSALALHALLLASLVVRAVRTPRSGGGTTMPS